MRSAAWGESETSRLETLRERLASYFAEMLDGDPLAVGKLAWRLSCFDSGSAYARYVEDHYFLLAGRAVLDTACGWGGHAVAFAGRGARVTAGDLNDHGFEGLQAFASENEVALSAWVADCEELPFDDASFDVILALDLVEHIESLDRFAAELARLLRPGGLCLMTTPARLRSIIEGEPHWQLRGLAALPFAAQPLVAQRLFGRSYPFPITRQFTVASRVLAPFSRRGLSGEPVLEGRLLRRIAGRGPLRSILRSLFWSFFVIRRPGTLS